MTKVQIWSKIGINPQVVVIIHRALTKIDKFQLLLVNRSLAISQFNLLYYTPLNNLKNQDEFAITVGVISEDFMNLSI